VKSLEMPVTALSHWWRTVAALSTVLLVDASLAENRALAFVTFALCGALFVYAIATITGRPAKDLAPRAATSPCDR
jgi:hypothetical protein